MAPKEITLVQKPEMPVAYYGYTTAYQEKKIPKSKGREPFRKFFSKSTTRPH